MKEIEARNRDIGAGAETNTNNINNSLSRSAGMKALKLPPFNEDKDVLDAYLIRFERPCITTTRRRRGWWLWWKAQLLKRFRLTEGRYRKRFKIGKLEPGETPPQFAERLKRNLEKWQKMAGFEPTYKGMQEMILRNQYFLTCDKSLQIFLKEKGRLSLKEMTKVSNDYFEAHGYPAENHEKKINGC